jgi:Dimerisation domain
MKLAPQAENLMERIALMANLVPRPFIDTQIAFVAARAIMVAAEVGIFEALGKAEQSAETIARDCGTNGRATKQLLDCLVGVGYASWRDGKYGLPAPMRKWLLRSSPNSIVNKLAYESLEWDFVGKTGDFVRTGKPLAVHEGFSQREWAVYQDAMRDVAQSGRGTRQATARSAGRDAASGYRRLARAVLDRIMQASSRAYRYHSRIAGRSRPRKRNRSA